MALVLKSKSGDELSLSPRYWSFFLTLAQVCEWKPAGTEAPSNSNLSENWNGDYESCEGQIVNDIDAREFSNGLNRCFYSSHCLQIMHDVATHIESQVEQKTGLTIPKEMRIEITDDFRNSLGSLMAFTHTGAFYIS